jgi:hypothetical protein
MKVDFEVGQKEVDEFCQKHGIAAHLETAKTLAERFFELDHEICEVVQDRDSGEEWIVVRIRVHGSRESVLAAKRQYTAQWIASVPWQLREKVMLSYDII